MLDSSVSRYTVRLYCWITLALVLYCPTFAVIWRGNSPRTSQSVQARNVAITPSYIRGPFNLSIPLHRGRSPDPLVFVQHFSGTDALVVDTRDHRLQIYGLSAQTVVYWQTAIPSSLPSITTCTLQIFYNTLFETSATRAQSRIYAILAAVNRIYAPLGIAFAVIPPLVLLPIVPALTPADTLTAFATYTLTFPEPVCTHLLFDGQVYPHNQVGLAYVNTTCSQPNNNALVAWATNPAAMVLIAAHELAHNMGVSHDGDHNSCLDTGHLMAPILDLTTNQFSDCSVHTLQQWLVTAERCPSCHNTTCITIDPPVSSARTSLLFLLLAFAALSIAFVVCSIHTK